MGGAIKAAEESRVVPGQNPGHSFAPTQPQDLQGAALPEGSRDAFRREDARTSSTPSPERKPLDWVVWQPLRVHLERHPEDTFKFTNGYHRDGSDRYVGELSRLASDKKANQKARITKLLKENPPQIKFDPDNMPLECMKSTSSLSQALDPRTPEAEKKQFFKQDAEKTEEMQRRSQAAREAERAERLQNVAAISLSRPGPRSPGGSKLIADALVRNEPGAYNDAIRRADQARRAGNPDSVSIRRETPSSITRLTENEYTHLRDLAENGRVTAISDLPGFLRNYYWGASSADQERCQTLLPENSPRSSRLAHDTKLGLALLAEHYKERGNVGALAELERRAGLLPGLSLEDRNKIFNPVDQTPGMGPEGRTQTEIAAGLTRAARQDLAAGNVGGYQASITAAAKAGANPQELARLEAGAGMTFMKGVFSEYERHGTEAQARSALHKLPLPLLEQACKDIDALYRRDGRVAIPGADPETEQRYDDFKDMAERYLGQRRQAREQLEQLYQRYKGEEVEVRGLKELTRPQLGLIALEAKTSGVIADADREGFTTHLRDMGQSLVKRAPAAEDDATGSEPARAPALKAAAQVDELSIQRADQLVTAFLKGDRGAPLRARAAELSIEELQIAHDRAPEEQSTFLLGLRKYIAERELSSVLYRQFAKGGSADLSGLKANEIAAVKKMSAEVASTHPGVQRFSEWLEQMA